MGVIMTSSLQLGINAAKAGRMQEALEYLKDAIIEEPQNAEVWVWIAAIIDDMDKQAIFLEKALEIDPHNIPAQRGLAYLEKRKQDEASVKDDHLSDHTRPISPFPPNGKRQTPVPPMQWSQHTVEELGEIAESDEKNSAEQAQQTNQPSNGAKLTPVEIGLLGVVALVFCFIGLLAGSALFDFELPLGFMLGERSALVSAPPFAGVFLYEDDMFFDMQQHEGLPTQDTGIPTSQKDMPLIVLYETIADRNQMKLIYETGAYIPIRGKTGPDKAVLIQPEQALQPGLYCFQQLNPMGEPLQAYYWCFKVDLSVNLE
jgi:tetratricopeptide (TPR) repeat protein